MCGGRQAVSLCGEINAKSMNEDEFQEIIRVQQLMAQRIVQERQTDNKIALLNIVNELTENGRKRVHTEGVLFEAQQQNILEREATRLLDELEKDHLIKQKAGFVERT